MGIGTIITLGVLAVILVYGITVYNGLVQIKHNVTKAWANIDVLLKQRHDELPKLVETCKQYMKFEQDTLTRVIEARSKVFSAREAQNVPALGQAEGGLRAALGSLFALAESYPDLKANQTFQQLSGSLVEIEDNLQYARRYYNGSVRELNVKVESFPSNLIANGFHFTKAEYFELEEADDRKLPEVKFS